MTAEVSHARKGTPVDTGDAGDGAREGQKQVLRQWHKSMASAAAALLLSLALIAPLVGVDRVYLAIFLIAGINVCLSLGLSISFGFTGLLNFAHGTSYAAGAYVCANGLVQLGWPFEICVLLAVLAGAIVGLTVGLVATRTDGDYFGLVTLVVAIGTVEVLNNWESATQGQQGFLGIPLVSVFGVQLDDLNRQYYAILAAVILVFAFCRAVTRGFVGRAMLATRDDPISAAMMGISSGRLKLVSMALSGGIAGLVGALLVATLGIITPQNFSLIVAFNVVIWVIVGGMSSLIGIAFAALSLSFLTELLRPAADISYGVMGLVVIAFCFVQAGVFRDWVSQVRGTVERARNHRR